MGKLKLGNYEIETLFKKLDIPKGFCWNYMRHLLLKGKYKEFLKIVIECLSDIRKVEEMLENE